MGRRRRVKNSTMPTMDATIKCSAPKITRHTREIPKPPRVLMWLFSFYHWPTRMTMNRAVMAKSTPVVSKGMNCPSTAPRTVPVIQ